MNKIFVEENGIYQIDLSETVNVVENLNEKYKSIGSFFADVDWIAETNEEVFLIEYKNNTVKNATKVDADYFEKNLKTEKFRVKLLNKYYGSTFYILAWQINKPINYICIIEIEILDSVLPKLIWSKIKKRLPYELQKNREITANLIKDFKILSIKEWNEQYPMFPLTKVK